MKKIGVGLFALLAGLALLSAGAAEQQGGVQKAVAVVHPLGKSKAHGVIRFTEKDGAVEIRGTIHGLTPGKHAFHIHEFGDCSAADGSSAGGHFNPSNLPHGAPDSEMRHAGDLGNIEADEKGDAQINATDKVLKLSGPTSIVGRAVIIHADADDFKTQPTGNAGGRVACGVVGLANPKPPVKK